MRDTHPVQIQIETQGAVPEGMPELAIAKVHSVLRLAAEPVLFARVTLMMAADPAVARPAVARVNVDLDGRLVRAQAAGQTMRESVQHMASRLRARLERSTRNWEARRGSRPTGAPGEWRHQSIPAH
jgi:predicted nucleic acid-binding Zn ribbon protein